MNPLFRPSTWFAAAFSFAVTFIGIWLLASLFLPNVDTEIISLAAVLVGAVVAYRLVRRIT